MQVKVLLFGTEARVAERREMVVETGESWPSCATVMARLGQSEPRLASMLPHCRLSINHEFAVPNDVIQEGDEVALIGVVSGG